MRLKGLCVAGEGTLLALVLATATACQPARPIDLENPSFRGKDFHPPRTAAERALDRVLLLDRDDDNSWAFVLGSTWYRAGDDPGYAALYTPALLASVRDLERRLVQESCGGEYQEGEICGLDYRPITCGQDVSDTGYVYLTIRQAPREALLTRAWPESVESTEPMGGPVYRMVEAGGTWKLDGIICSDRFNFPLP